jgi:hypothetical protein
MRSNRRLGRGRFSGPSSVATALERLGTPKDVLIAHRVRVRAREFFCPFHANSKTAAGSLYERAGKQRWHCHSCDRDGDALDLEAALSGKTLREILR